MATMTKRITKVEKLAVDTIWKNADGTFAKVIGMKGFGDYGTVTTLIRQGTPGRYQLDPVDFTRKTFLGKFSFQS